MEQRWIPVSERLPDADKYILVSFENFTISDIGRYETDKDGSGAFYPGNDDKSYVEYGLFVNAWMPMPEPYREGEDSMERLTAKNDVGSHYFSKCFEKCGGLGASDKCDNCENTISICEKLGAYEDAEEQGLLLRLPCNVGDKAYIIAGKDISKQTIQRVTIGSDKILEFCTRKRGFAISDIGKKVFLTREEAEAKLKEMEEKDGR